MYIIAHKKRSLQDKSQYVKKTVKYRNGFLEKSCKYLQPTKIKKKIRVTQTILERLENNMFKWHGHVLRM
jgi:hypothetical protein